jgi:hypothetical protein
MKGRNLYRKASLIGALVAASLSVAFAAPQSAHASAYGCTVFGFLTPDSYCVYLSGSGTYVSYVNGSWAVSSYGDVCNWQITAEFFDTNWNWYRTSQSVIHWGCAGRGQDWIYINGWMRSGYMCSTLTSYGSRKASVCHAIHP